MSRLNVGIIEATSKFKIPTFTTIQRDAMVPETGIMIYNSTDSQVQIYFCEWVGAGDIVSTAGSSFTATGGTITSSSGYKIHTFLNSGSFDVSVGTTTVEYLIVAGGGGGGMDMGGGGGAGGVIIGSTSLGPGSYPVTVGAGGNGAPAASTNGQSGGHQYTISATKGINSTFNNLTAVGGGLGGSSYYGYTPNYGYGGTGGSGGGNSGYSDGNVRPPVVGTTLQGNNGGQGGGQYYSGGGGGAGGAGANSTAQPNGGVGVQSSILGVSYFWGGGGGGSSY